MVGPLTSAALSPHRVPAARKLGVLKPRPQIALVAAPIEEVVPDRKLWCLPAVYESVPSCTRAHRVLVRSDQRASAPLGRVENDCAHALAAPFGLAGNAAGIVAAVAAAGSGGRAAAETMAAGVNAALATVGAGHIAASSAPHELAPSTAALGYDGLPEGPHPPVCHLASASGTCPLLDD